MPDRHDRRVTPMLTEDEMMETWCRYATVGRDGNRMVDGKPNPGAMCLGSGCGAWRWELKQNYHLSPRRRKGGRGYCGAAAPP